MPCAPFIFLSLILVILQTALFPFLPGWFSQIDPLFILVVFIAVKLDPYRGAVLVVFIGMLMDIVSGVYSGLHPVLFVFLLFFIKGLSRPLVLTELPHQIPLILTSYLLVTSGGFVIISVISPDTAPDWSWSSVFIRMILLAVLAIPLFSFYDFTMEKISPRKALEILIRPKKSNRFN